MDKNNGPLKVALHGMDERSSKMMAMYLQGPCRGVAVVVNNDSADVDIFDADSVVGQQLLQERLEKEPLRPVLMLSVRDRQQTENALSVKKPVKTEDMLAALAQARARIGQKTKSGSIDSKPTQLSGRSNTPTHDTVPVNKAVEVPEPPVLKKYVINSDEQKKTSKHQAAMQLSETGFGAFIGNVPGVDVNDPRQLAKAGYNPKDYFQGYIESAFKVSREKGQSRQLNSGWNPLVILPNNDEVWLDVDESQLRAFAGLAINSTLGSKMSVTPLSQDMANAERTLERFHSMDAFLWKAACWASKGRYPVTIDVRQPVYLKNWPNFTRLLVTPHAMRIAALLIQSPRSLSDIAETLNIKPQYVFVFISAASSLGLVSQAKKEASVLVQPPEVKPKKNQGVLSRILGALLGKKA
jgi:hypothetical protein